MHGSTLRPVCISFKRTSSQRWNLAVPSCAGVWRRRMWVIRGRVFFRGQLEPLSVGIDEDGRVAAIKKVLRGDEEIDHGDALILPGCVDLHVHMRDPGLKHKEDFPSGTRSAAIGGVTTTADMPNTVPAVMTTEGLDGKGAEVHGRGDADNGPYGAPRQPGAGPARTRVVAVQNHNAGTAGKLP